MIENGCPPLTLLAKIRQRRMDMVSWLWQKKMMYNRSGLAGCCRKNLQHVKPSELIHFAFANSRNLFTHLALSTHMETLRKMERRNSL